MKRLSHENRLQVADKIRPSQSKIKDASHYRQAVRTPIFSPLPFSRGSTDPEVDGTGGEKVSQSLTQERKEEKDLKEKPT